MNHPADAPQSDAALLGQLDLTKAEGWSELERAIGPLREIRTVPWSAPFDPNKAARWPPACRL